MIQVKKASGELEPFNEEKVIRALQRAGADQNIADGVLIHLKKKLYDGIPTHKIYSYVYEALRKENPSVLGRLNLRKAIMELGPTGYPFEKFIGAILASYGYIVETGITVAGRCVNHEVDVVAQKDNQHFMVECKFHNQPGTRTDIKVALYVKARFDDVTAVWKEKPEHRTKFHQAWLVTNTKLTSDAIQYGECAGMKIVSWSYPDKGSLQDLIEGSGLHPITCLSSLSRQQKEALLARNIVLCKDIPPLAMSAGQMEKLKAEIKQLCGVPKL